MRSISFLLALLAFLNIYAQDGEIPDGIERAYYISLKGDTIPGFIESAGDLAIENTISFSDDPNGGFKLLSPGQALGFGLTRYGRHYRSFKEYEGKFLRVLVDGRVSLFYSAADKGQFFAWKNGQFTPLKSEKIIKEGKEFYSKDYVRVLGFLLNDAPKDMSFQTNKVAYKQDPLIKLLDDYNSQFGESVNYLKRERSSKKLEFNFIPSIGYGQIYGFEQIRFDGFSNLGVSLEIGTSSIGDGTFILLDFSIGKTEIIASNQPGAEGLETRFRQYSFSFGYSILRRDFLKIKGTLGLTRWGGEHENWNSFQSLDYPSYGLGPRFGFMFLFKDRINVSGSLAFLKTTPIFRTEEGVSFTSQNISIGYRL